MAPKRPRVKERATKKASDLISTGKVKIGTVERMKISNITRDAADEKAGRNMDVKRWAVSHRALTQNTRATSARVKSLPRAKKLKKLLSVLGK